MNYYNFWTWVLLYAGLVIWLPLGKLAGLGSYSWWTAFAPVWGAWALAALGLLVKGCYRLLQAWRPAKGGVL
jgi:hypothetical protein